MKTLFASQGRVRQAQGIKAKALQFLLSPGFLLQVDLAVSLLFVAPGKPPATEVAGERLLPSVGPDVGGQVVTAAEVPQADTALEGLMPSMDPQVPVELVRAGKAPDAVLHWAGKGLLIGFGSEAFGWKLIPSVFPSGLYQGVARTGWRNGVSCWGKSQKICGDDWRRLNGFLCAQHPWHLLVELVLGIEQDLRL